MSLSKWMPVPLSKQPSLTLRLGLQLTAAAAFLVAIYLFAGVGISKGGGDTLYDVHHAATFMGEPRFKDAGWAETQAALVADLNAWRGADPPLQVVLYGDSITESWRGTSMNGRLPRTNNMEKVFATEFTDLTALPMGISGDRTETLMWRLRNGELPEWLQPAVFVLLIGTNDLGWALESGRVEDLSGEVPRVLDNLEALLVLLLEACPRSQIILQALLPRGDRSEKGPDGSRTYDLHQPSRFTEAIEQINFGMRTLADTVKDSYRIGYVDCGKGMLIATGGPINPKLMPDGLHPNTEGGHIMASCLRTTVLSRLSSFEVSGA